MKRGKDKSGQVWVETVIYTLIALTMIGAVLTFVIPKVGEIQDKSVIEQSINAMKDINNVILSVVQGGVGNKRLVEAKIKKGTLTIDAQNDEILFEIETDYVYSEPCESEPCTPINIGNIGAVTKKVGGINKVILTSKHDEHDITFNRGDTKKKIEQSSVPYTLSIENKGEISGKTNIDINLS